jgi:hypothetical protein
MRCPGRVSHSPRAGRRLRQSCALGTAVLLVLSLALPAPAQPSQAPPAENAPVTLVADHIEYDTETGAVTADGHVEVSRGGVVIRADHLVGNVKTGEVEATGNVTLVRGSQTATAESLQYNFLTRTGRTGRAVTQYGAWHVESESSETSGGRAVAYGATVTPCDPQHPIFHVTARRVVIYPGDYLTAYGAALYVYSVHVVTVPSYSVSLDPRRPLRSGPSFGYTPLDGPYFQYNQFFILGSAIDDLRLRYGATTNFTAENILNLPGPDHLWSLRLGRREIFDINGNMVNLDAESLDLTYDAHKIGGWPFSYQLEAHAGDYSELATGVHTTREDGLLSVATDTFVLSPKVIAGASGSVEYDAYGTGQQRTMPRVTAAVTEILSRIESVTLAYNSTAVVGSTPFSFDNLGPDSSVALSYINSVGVGLLQTWGLTVSYDFYSDQTTLAGLIALAISPTVQFNASASYNLTTQQVSEVDYALNVQCDCVAIGLVYRTFPQTPSLNQFALMVGLAPTVTAAPPPAF